MAELKREAAVEDGNVVVDVQDGVVVLTGTVPTSEGARAAWQIASRTRGVLDVISQLRVG